MVTESTRISADNRINVRSEASKRFKTSSKGKIYELETNGKSVNIRDLYRSVNDIRKVTSLELI